MCRQISINLCESDSVCIQCTFLSGKIAQCYENIQDVKHDCPLLKTYVEDMKQVC